MKLASLLAVAALVSGCTLDVPPSVPEASSGGTLVVADPRGKAGLELDGYGRDPDLDCEEVCPVRTGVEIDACHPTTLDARMGRHVAYAGAAEARWIVCYYEVD